MLGVRSLAKGMSSNQRQFRHQLQLTRSSSRFDRRSEAEDYWPREIPRMIGWQLNPTKRFCLRITSTIRPEVQLVFAEKRKDQDLICQVLHPPCLKALFNYYAEPNPTVNVKAREILSSAYILEPKRVVFYKDYSFEEEAWSISSITVRQKLLPRKPNILFELSFYTAVARAVNMKHLADLRNEHKARSSAFDDDDDAKEVWIQWSELFGPKAEADEIAANHDIPYRDILRYLEILNYGNGDVMRQYDVNRLLDLYDREKEERSVDRSLGEEGVCTEEKIEEAAK